MERNRDPNFVAAFASSNFADVSPNTKGAFCDGTDLPCNEYSQCPVQHPRTLWKLIGIQNNVTRMHSTACNGRGPGWGKSSHPDKESARIIRERQADKAETLIHQENQIVLKPGSLDAKMIWVDMSNYTLIDGLSKTCKAAVGRGFGAGITDGPGIDPFNQGNTEPLSPHWRLARNIINKAPNKDQQICMYFYFLLL